MHDGKCAIGGENIQGILPELRIRHLGLNASDCNQGIVGHAETIGVNRGPDKGIEDTGNLHTVCVVYYRIVRR